MSVIKRVAVFWFRRDLRLDDNHGLFKALNSGLPVVPVFIFDPEIIRRFPSRDDVRLVYILQQLIKIQKKLILYNSSLRLYYGNPRDVWSTIIKSESVNLVFANEEYEPYTLERDKIIHDFLKKKGIDLLFFTDHLINHPSKILKQDGKPYQVFTAYKNARQKKQLSIETYPSESLFHNFLKCEDVFKIPPELQYIGTVPQIQEVDYPDDELLLQYEHKRDFPSCDATSRIGIHLRYGSISVRKLYNMALPISKTYVNELIWREFYAMILFYFPEVIKESFNPKYRFLPWVNNEEYFEAWKTGNTGFPFVDAGMRQLNKTGWMHNRLRMITASFLVKHLLIDWRWGEQYFAQKLHDFELSSNNGGWQWAAGTGTDAAPYFRVFSPALQQKRFDPHNNFVLEWVPEFENIHYPKPIVNHRSASQGVKLFYNSNKNV